MRVGYRSAFAIALVIVTLSARGHAAATKPVVYSGDHQIQSVDTLPLSGRLPTDPQIRSGTLANGLTYYVRPNRRPEQRAELRLVVKAGSILEDDDQLGLAHMVEHMAFNGTALYPGQELVKFLESLGMRFGAHVNAYTSFDETVYQLTVPTDKPDVLQKALSILEQWAQHVSFTPEEVDRERAVVIEEWRTGRGAGARTSEKVMATTLRGSRYPDRRPIGKPEVLRSFAHDRLKQFYRDWYRPDLMAVIAVGDFDASLVEQQITKRFESLPRPANARPRPWFGIPDHRGTVYSIVADKEATTTFIELETKLAGRDWQTVQSRKERILDEVVSDLMQARFDEITERPGSPFTGVFGPKRYRYWGRDCDACPAQEEIDLMAWVPDAMILPAFQALATEIERATRFGFTETEIRRVVRNTLRERESDVAAEATAMSAQWANRCVEHFLNQTPLVPAGVDLALHQRFLEALKTDDIADRVRNWFPSDNRIITVTTREASTVALPTEASIAAALSAAKASDLKPYVDSVPSGTLLGKSPVAGRITRESRNDSIDLTEWTLSNGARVVLKPTAFERDAVVMRATSPGGTSLATDEDFVIANSAIEAVTLGGLGAFDAVDLGKVLTGKVARAFPFINELEEGLSGSASVQDLETLFQLIYLRFTQPRADPSAFRARVDQMSADLANRDANPNTVFNDALRSLRFQNHARRRPETAATVKAWDLEKSLAFYRNRFADASDFTFVFVGNINARTAKPLVEKYLASLPSLKRKESWKDVGVRTPDGIVEKTIETGLEQRARTVITFSGPYAYSPGERGVTFLSMANILERRLHQVIREQLGGTYNVFIGKDFWPFPRAEYSLVVQFEHDPERTQELFERVMTEIRRYQADGPTPQEIEAERLARLREFETSRAQNAFLANQLINRYRLGEDPASVWDRPKYFDQIDIAGIQAAARKYFDMNRYVKATLLPARK